MTEEILTQEELAKRWGMSTGTLSNWRSLGKGPKFFKYPTPISKKVRYRLKDVIAFESTSQFL